MSGDPYPSLLLGLLGPAGSGKTTVATLLEDQFAFEAIAFGDPIAEAIMAIASHADVGGEWSTERALKEQPMPVLGRSYRELAQTIGTECGRNLWGADFWIRIAAHKADQAVQRGNNVVLTDVRFVNEALWVKQRGGHLVRIERPSVEPVRAHVSESEQGRIGADFTVRNTSTPHYLQFQLDALVAHLGAAQRP